MAEHLTELEAEIGRLGRAVSDLTLDKLILVEATTGNPRLRLAGSPDSSGVIRGIPDNPISLHCALRSAGMVDADRE